MAGGCLCRCTLSLVKWFDYAAPRTLAEATSLMNSHRRALLLAGGTDLLVQLRARRKETDLVIDLKRIPELTRIAAEADGLSIGAAVPCCEVYEHALVRKMYPSLAHTAMLIGGTPIQGRASLGGNLCNAAPSGDSIPMLIALGAMARIASSGGTRDVPVETFCTAPGKNMLQPGELVVAIRLPNPPAGFGAHYERFIPRNEMDIAVVGVGASLTVRDGLITAARVALASVAPTPLFVPEAGDSLVGKAAGDGAFAEAAAMAQAAAKPISDMRGPAEYRKHLVGVLVRRTLAAAAKEIALAVAAKEIE